MIHLQFKRTNVDGVAVCSGLRPKGSFYSGLAKSRRALVTILFTQSTMPMEWRMHVCSAVV